MQINLLYFLILFIIFILFYNFYDKLCNNYFNNSLIEGLDNNCSNDESTLIYKNAGAIENLKSSVEKLSKQINQTIITNDKHTSQIDNLTSLETKFDSLSQKADNLANDNKQRLMEMAKQAHKKAQIAQKQSDSIKFK
jgi:hypothetical protein